MKMPRSGSSGASDGWSIYPTSRSRSGSKSCPVELSGGAAQRLRGDTLALLQHDQDAGRYVLIAARSLFREEDSVTAEGAHTRQVLRMRGLLEAVQQTAYILVDCSDA